MRKGPGILKKVFQRVVMVSISILAQIVVFALVIWRFQDNSEIIYVILLVVSMAAALAIISKNTNPAYKIAWLVPILLFPVFGGLFYLMLGGNRLSRRQQKKLERVERNMRRHLPANPETAEELRARCSAAAMQSTYLTSVAGCPPYTHTETKYFPLGDIAYPVMLEELQKAEKYIFLEYFIIGEGVMWDGILEILRHKAQTGLDVRVMYDDMGSFMTLSAGYARQLEKRGVKCVSFNRVQRGREGCKVCAQHAYTALPCHG